MSKSNFTFSRQKLKKLGKLSFFCAGIFLTLIVSGAGGYLLWFYNFREVPPPPDVKIVLPNLRHGDIILRSGVGLWSELFRERNTHDKRFSHVGIVIVENGNVRVLHSEGDDISGRGTVRFDSIETFVGESSGVGISRFHSLDAAKVADAAKSFYGRPFDWKFDSDDNSALYCTELIDNAMRQAYPQAALKLTDSIILVESCLDPHYFTEVNMP